MSNRKWNKGKPPHRGWYNAGTLRQERIWRFWNGEYWSRPVHERFDIGRVKKLANQESKMSIRHIEWCDYWPENARVPRINPDKEQ